MWAQTIKFFAANAPHLPKVVHAVKRTALITMLDHPLSELGTDARQSL